MVFLSLVCFLQLSVLGRVEHHSRLRTTFLILQKPLERTSQVLGVVQIRTPKNSPKTLHGTAVLWAHQLGRVFDP